VNKIEVLIISNKLDFSTDYITYELKKLDVPYLRINRDNFMQYSIKLLPKTTRLYFEIDNKKFYVSKKFLKSIYFRAPTFIRILKPYITPEEQLYLFQWNSFLRNLIIFGDLLWVNNPVQTYKAENKLYQLKIAKECGFKIPKTIITNDIKTCNIKRNEMYIIKTLEPCLLNIKNNEAFIYTNTISGKNLLQNDLKLAPIIIQELLEPKKDIRVTIVGNKIWAIKILKKGKAIKGDWRKIKKEKLEYIPINLPDNIVNCCFKLIKSLELNYGAIDLVEYKGDFYFLEINPTGEWGWLVNQVKFNINEELAYLLSKGKSYYEKKS